MRFNYRFVLLIAAFFILFASELRPYNISAKNTLVAGFINRGDESDDNINPIITKSLITFLAKLPGVEITSYPDLERISLSNGFWKSGKINIDAALQMAQNLNADHLIVGDYKVNGITKRIQINLFAYDVITGKLLLKRTITGSTGLELFDAIDTIKKNISGLLFGKDLSFGKISLEINGTSRSYKVYAGGKFISEVSNRNGFEDQFIAGEEMEISLRLAESGKEVLRESFVLNKNEKKSIIYQPSGSIIVKSMADQSLIYLDNKEIGKINRDESITIPGVTADTDHIVGLKKESRIEDVKKVNIPEGETEIVIIGAKKADIISYKNTLPLMDLAIPGFAQYQAGDGWMGTLFLTLGIGGAGLTLFSEIAYGKSYSKYQIAEGDIKALYYSDSQFWQVLSITGICLWAGSAVVSVFHAYTQPGFGLQKNDENYYWACALIDGGMELRIAGRF